MRGYNGEYRTLPVAGDRTTSVMQRNFEARGCLCRWYNGNCIVAFSPECPVLGDHYNVPVDLLGFDFQIERVVNEIGA